MRFEGRIWVLGDDIDTDIIISGKYLRSEDSKLWADHVLEVLGNEYSTKIKQGDLIVAGENFGCGSSREQAAIAIKEAGIAAVIACSFGRIFFRNSLNIGLPVIICAGIKNMALSDGDVIFVDLKKGELKFEKNTLQTEPLPDFMMEILSQGGLLEYFNNREAINGG